jgi:hypothetical protein
MDQPLSAFSMWWGCLHLIRFSLTPHERDINKRLKPMLRLSKFKDLTMKCPICTDTPMVMAERQGVVGGYGDGARDAYKRKNPGCTKSLTDARGQR